MAGLLLSGCSVSVGRVAPFQGRVVAIVSADSLAQSDSAQGDTIGINISGYTGNIIYDREMDGVYDDTLSFFGTEDGQFSGVIEYRSPVNISAPWVRRTAQVVIPEAHVDTFLEIDAYLRDAKGGIEETNWGPIVARGEEQKQ